jgi:DNA polymerase (family 10)
MENIDVANAFEEVADLLEIQGANPFRIRAYREAARTIGTLNTPVESLVEKDGGALAELPGIGADLAGKIIVLCRTGTLPLLNQLKRKTPATLVTLLRIPGIGPKRAKLLYKKLGVKTIPQLEKAARAGRLSKVRGLGPTIERAILQGIEQEKVHRARFPIAEAEAHIRPLVELLRATPGVRRLDIAGSIRRRKDTVGDVDVLISATDPATVTDAFTGYEDVKRVLARGETRSAVRLSSGLQVDLRVVPESSYGAALHYFTGSKPHNIAVRLMGVKRHLKINEYGVFRGERQVGGRTEKDVYAAVGLPWIPPELREDRGELEVARTHRLPHLVEIDDIRGDLQMHTTSTDGHNSLVEMVEACVGRGYGYIAITDHTKAVRVAGGLTSADFRRQSKEIDKVRKQFKDIVIFKSAEVDILEDGSLDLDDGMLGELDVVLVSVHSGFNMNRDAMTRRIIKALRHPHVHILGHPTGRLLGKREPFAVDMEQVVRAAVDHGVLLEINAQPDRLDLDDLHVAMARTAGAMLVISTDAHRVGELAYMQHGVDQARRGWCEAKDVANTRSAARFRKLLER